MQKRTGKYVVERYDQYGHKKKLKSAKNYQIAVRKADDWENMQDGYSAVVLRILYNTKEKRTKF